MERHNGLEPDPEGAFVYHDDAQAQIAALTEALECALLEKPLPNGEYAHHAACNGDRRKPAGTLGLSCSCRVGRATIAALQARVQELEAQSLKQAEEAAVMFAELTTLRGLVGALVYQLTDSGWTDLHGHTIEKNVAFIAARAALLQHRQGME